MNQWSVSTSMDKVVGLARLLRIPGLGALGIPPVIGALTVGVTDLFSLILLFLIGCLAAMFGFILNDFVDAELDRLVPELAEKPLVNGSVSRKTAVFICFFCAMFAFLFLMILWRGQTLDSFKLTAGVSLVMAGVLGSIYDMFGKKLPGSDLFVAISMSFLVLMGALSFGAPTVFTWLVFALTFSQTLHMNAVEGGIKDADHDYKMGVVNLASLAGVRVRDSSLTIPWSFKAFGMGLRLSSAVLVFTPLLLFNYAYEPWMVAILALVVVGVLFFSIRLLTLTTFDRRKIRQYIGLQSFLRYSVVPIMLLPITSVPIMIVLIAFPIVWYLAFTPLLKEKLFQPRM